MLDRVGLAVGDDDVGAVGEDRGDQLGNDFLRVLVVAIGVDDDVGTEFEAGVDATLEGFGQPLVADVAHDVVDAVPSRGLDRGIGATVVDDEDFDRFDAGDMSWDRREGGREGSFFVEAGYLDD
jgi:hypothetical protein